jgi:hypothetical protein
MRITAATAPGDPATPNEDWFAATPNLIVVLDGATIRTETGCRHGAAWYTRQLGAAILTHTRDDRPLPHALHDAIADVAEQHPGCDLSHPGTPSAAVGIARLTTTDLQYLVLGDVTLVIGAIDGHAWPVSDPRISATAAVERRAADRYPIGSPEKAAALIPMKHAELAARNTADGYWIAATDPAAAYHSTIGQMSLHEIERLAVLTDGAARYTDLFQLGDWASALRVLESSGPRWFIDKMVRPVETADPLGVRYPRNKRSDDATVVYAVPTTGPARTLTDDVELQVQEDLADELLRRLNDPRVYGDGNLQRAMAERGCS